MMRFGLWGACLFALGFAWTFLAGWTLSLAQTHHLGQALGGCSLAHTFSCVKAFGVADAGYLIVQLSNDFISAGIVVTLAGMALLSYHWSTIKKRRADSTFKDEGMTGEYNGG